MILDFPGKAWWKPGWKPRLLIKKFIDTIDLGTGVHRKDIFMDRHPHEKIFDQIAELLQFAYDNANKPINHEKIPEIETKLDALEKQVEEFKKISDKILEGSGLTDYAFETMKGDKNSSILSDIERSLLDRAEFLKNEAKAASKDLQAAASEAQMTGKNLSGQPKEKRKSAQSRKNKFRSFGGVKNWKPL